ncbi:MAG TPA: GntR family transcriptional regulator [Desulfosporosinus sp.]|nr:GntR family transcriptional regulator [Desulfosporosinus sp.]
MPDIPKIDNEELSDKARKVMITMLRDGAFEKTGRLPSEELLAQKLGVSRTVVRDVLAALEGQGFITRRRGIGTIINNHVLQVTSRLDLEKEFLEEIADVGYIPRIAYVKPSMMKADPIAAQHLRVDEGDELIVVERLVLADQRPAILCIDHIPQKLVMDPTYQTSDLEPPIFQFLQHFCHCSVEMDITKIEPCLVDKNLAAIFEVNEGSPMLHLNEVGFDIRQRPVLWSKEYYAPGILEFTVLRRKV